MPRGGVAATAPPSYPSFSSIRRSNFLNPHLRPLSKHTHREYFMTTRLTQLSSQLTTMASSTSRPDIHLYTTQTPNGIKISITLEELGIPYTVHKIDISKNTQKEPWFLEINPNGRIPALTDTFTDGKTIRLFESGSIQQYLVDQYDKDYKISYPRGTREYYETNNWLFFLNAGVGP